MKHLLLTTIAAVVLVGCGKSQQSAPAPETPTVELVAEAATPEPPTAKAPDISIHKAAYDGNIEAVKQHLAAGADVNAKDKKRWTPLHRAVQKGHKKIVELLIANGSDVNAKNQNRYTPLHKAVDDGHKEIVELLIANGSDVNAKDDEYGSTPLHNAVLETHKEIVELLIAKGADVNAKDNNGVTPLHITAQYVHKEIAELLISEGADVNAQDNDGETPLDWAIEFKETELADLLRKHGGKTGAELWAEESILGAANIGDIKLVEKYLSDGADVNATSEMWDGMTPLHIAAEGGHNEIAELLIAKGADLTAKDQNPFVGGTPLDWAIKRGKNETADIIRKHGGKYSKIRFAARGGDIKAVKEFLAAGADVNAKDERGGTPLDGAIQRKRTKTADLLRKHGGKTGEELKAEGK